MDGGMGDCGRYQCQYRAVDSRPYFAFEICIEFISSSAVFIRKEIYREVKG